MTEERRKEIRKEIEDAVSRSDLDAVRSLYEELMVDFDEIAKEFGFYDAESVASAEGEFNASERKYDINWSEIMSALIKEAGAKCDRYASDVYIELKSIDEELSSGAINCPIRIFGFRDSGVDGNAYVTARLESPEVYGTDCYKSIWMLKTSFSDETFKELITMDLRRLS